MAGCSLHRAPLTQQMCLKVIKWTRGSGAVIFTSRQYIRLYSSHKISNDSDTESKIIFVENHCLLELTFVLLPVDLTFPAAVCRQLFLYLKKKIYKFEGVRDHCCGFLNILALTSKFDTFPDFVMHIEHSCFTKRCSPHRQILFSFLCGWNITVSHTTCPHVFSIFYGANLIDLLH